jgi:hypothetical protein
LKIGRAGDLGEALSSQGRAPSQAHVLATPQAMIRASNSRQRAARVSGVCRVQLDAQKSGIPGRAEKQSTARPPLLFTMTSINAS